MWRRGLIGAGFLAALALSFGGGWLLGAECGWRAAAHNSYSYHISPKPREDKS